MNSYTHLLTLSLNALFTNGLPLTVERVQLLTDVLGSLSEMDHEALIYGPTVEGYEVRVTVDVDNWSEFTTLASYIGWDTAWIDGDDYTDTAVVQRRMEGPAQVRVIRGESRNGRSAPKYMFPVTVYTPELSFEELEAKLENMKEEGGFYGS